MKNKSSPYTSTPADPDRHLMAIAKITSEAFAGGQYVKEIADTYINNCHYDWEATRLIWDRERLIHHWGVWGYPMRLGPVQLQVAGIGAVVTEEPYRKHGLMGQAALASFESMFQQGYDLSILRGRHYVKFGYARAWNYITYRLKAEEVPDLPLLHPYRKLDTEHIEAMGSLYNQTHQTFTGTAVRPTYRLKSSDDMSAYGWFDETGNLIGYVRATPPEDDKESLQCLESAGDPGQALAVLRELFTQGKYKSMSFFTLPHQHPLLQLIRLGNCIVETRYFATSGWRVRIVNLHSTLEKIRPLLEERLQSSHFAEWKGKLLLDAGEQKAVLEIEKGHIQVTKARAGKNRLEGRAGIGRLLIGSDDPQEVIRHEKIICTGEASRLAVALFPNLYPMLSQWDEC
jgi:predicted acetyltransferase